MLRIPLSTETGFQIICDVRSVYSDAEVVAKLKLKPTQRQEHVVLFKTCSRSYIGFVHALISHTLLLDFLLGVKPITIMNKYTLKYQLQLALHCWLRGNQGLQSRSDR